MFSSRIARKTTTAIAVGAFGLAAFAGIATANASAVDDAFLANIAAEGIGWDSASTVINQGHLVCSYFDDGGSVGSIGAEILDATDLTSRQAAVFMVAAVSAYCPTYLGEF